MDWIEKMKTLFHLPAIPFTSTPSALTSSATTQDAAIQDAAILSATTRTADIMPSPWGWSPDVARTFQLAGVDTASIPNQQKLSAIRQLSHRRSSILINQQLKDSGIDTPPLATEISNPGDLPASPDIYFKSPWSSSGRGVYHAGSLPPHQAIAQATGVIKHQGSVIAEKALDKILDFAMLFNICDSKITYCGLSLFSCNSLGAYTGNIVASQEYLTSQICAYGISPKALDSISSTLSDILGDLIGNTYSGPLGIDMMIYRKNHQSIAIAPCVELNLRNTMGHVALSLAQNHLHPQSIGTFTIIREPRPAKTASQQSNPSHNADNHIEGKIIDHKLYQGEILLTPPGLGFQFHFKANI